MTCHPHGTLNAVVCRVFWFRTLFPSTINCSPGSSVMAGDTSRNKSDEANHPVVSMLRELDESFISQANLDGFMNFLTLTSSFYDENSDLNTMTKFIKRYVDFQVFVDTCPHNVEQHGTFFRTLDISDEKKKIFYKSLGQISFSNLVLSKEIKWTALKEQFYLETSPIFNKFDSTEKLNPMKVLRQVEGTQGSLWTFREKLVQAYLAAFYQVDKMLEAASSRVKRKLIGKKLTQSIKRMPLTFDMWLMTFGLALEHISLKSHLRDIASEFFGIWKSSFIELSPQSTIKGRQWINKISTSGNEVACSVNDHLSCFFVELIYETSNVDNLVTFSNSILENESINYSGLNISKGRALYCLHAIGGFLMFCPIIYGIHLTDMNINEGNIKAVLEPLLKIPVNDIQVLNLSNNSIGYKGMRVLFRFFVRASDLTHLDMSCCNLGDRGVSLIVQTFICMPLVYINLSSNEIGEFGSKLLSKNLCYVPSLEWLDLSNNNLGAGAILLASVMSKLPCLRFLNLGSNKVDDEGAVALARLIEESSTMEEVVISRNIISGRGCRALAEKVIRSKSLKSLDVRNNKIPSSGVIKLRKAARSHGTLQVSTWEQNPASDLGKQTEEGDTEMEQLLGRLDFQLSIAISKVSGGTLYAKVKEGVAHPTGVVITNPSYQNQASPAVTPAMDSISIANGDDNHEIVSGESQSSIEESKCITLHSDMRNCKTDDCKEATWKSSPIGTRSASTGKINFRRFVSLQRKSMSRICSKDIIIEMQNAEQKKAQAVYNKCFTRFNSQKPSSDLC